MEFKINFEMKSDSVSITMSGFLNGTREIDVYDFGFARHIDVDFGGIKYINSTGIAAWVKWVERVETRHPQKLFRLWNCPKVIIDQANVIVGFLPQRCVVQSFYVPYYNEDQGIREDFLYLREKDYREQGSLAAKFVNIPEVRQNEQGVTLEIDVFPETYFAFLNEVRGN